MYEPYHRPFLIGETVKLLRSSLVSIARCLLVAFTLLPGAARAQGKMSPEDEAIYKAMMRQSMGADAGAAIEAGKNAELARRWTEGTGIVRYHIVGEFKGRANVVGDPNWTSFADVTDRVVIDLDWKLADLVVLGTPIIQNAKSTVKNLRNYEPTCAPPILNGEYEHYELLGIKPGLAGQLELQVQTSYPAAQVAQDCTGKRMTVPAARKVRSEEFNVPSPVLLTMKLPDSDDLRLSPDKKSLITKKDGWAWTFTPSVKK